MIRTLTMAFTLILSLAFPVPADSITIAAASDLKFAMDEIVNAFQQSHPADTIELVYGSSGKFHTQIQQGAPYDLYFSADIAYPRALAEKGLAGSEVIPYAVGRIVLWSATLDASTMTLESLDDPSIRRIAIANPRHAPYGQRAEEALRASGLWDRVEAKLVYGESIAHAAQFVQTGNAQVGVLALSLVLNAELSSKGSHYLIPEALHRPLEQGFIITQRGKGKGLAQKFAEAMRAPETRATLTKYGFILPGAESDD